MHLFPLVLCNLLEDKVGEVVFAHVRTQVDEVFVGVAHEISEDGVVYCVRFPSLHHLVLVLEF